MTAFLEVVSHTFPFPLDTLDRWPTHPVVTDRSGRVLLERVGSDEQWRQPVPLSKMSPWLPQAMIAAEDERFYSHPGVDAIAVARAVVQNLGAGRTRSGASTLSMQVCRMIDDRPRSLWAKAVEAFRAVQLERLRSKDEILAAHLNLAPFGGNLRGVEAASRAYFGKPSADLSLGEAALLAGLPQSPSRYRPTRNPEQARARRAYVLRRMVELQMISNADRARAEAEPVPETLWPKTQSAAHAAWLALERRPQGGRTTLELDVQHEVEAVVERARMRFSRETDVAVVAIDVATGEVRALVGSPDAGDPVDGQVNGVLRPRSPGSALKPFLYAAAFEARQLAPDSLLKDEPIDRDGWSPVNFDRTFAGDVTAAEALRRSLNVPAILATESAGLPRCVGVLEAAGVRLPPDAHRRGGLALAVGALEVTLLDLTNAYATLARGGVRQQVRLFAEDAAEPVRVLEANVCSAVNDILSSRNRDPSGLEATAAADRPWFMWKTGTSSGRRDAWAVGHNQRWAVGVWVGEFSGQGHPVFVGRAAAEPILVELFARTALRHNGSPPAWKPWTVNTTIAAKSPSKPLIRITSPAADEEFIALNGESIVPVSGVAPERTQWFLNGRLLGETVPQRLSLPPGSHEIRAAASGATASVRFRVVP